MKRSYIALIALLCLAGSCADKPAPKRPEPSVPAPEPAQSVPPPPVSSAPAVPEPVFDPSSITQEEKDTAKLEIQRLIQRLNGIIRARNYDTWVSYLDPGYFAAINSPEYLNRVSQSAVLVKQKIVLTSAEDYFNHVVVPSRTNDRVDDIEFISQNRVKAYTINTAGNRLRLYDLEKSGTGWKIIN
ncbi:MAG: hypothetical protein LBK77_09040 [Spirochaetaceae bacterium]|jgi:hypothetical protein|nr:hypothetical protein [Spirochaetaceae bacterium]